MIKNKNLTDGNIKKQLYALTWPMLFGMMGMVVFNLVDTFFVGQLGVKQLAAMSFTFPVIMFYHSLALGVGIGTSSLISRNIISIDRQKVKMMATSAILLGLVIVLCFVVIGLLTIKPMFLALGASGEILDYVYDYMSIWYVGMPFVVIPMIGNNIVRATGDTFTPGMIMLAIAMVNAVLDPLLIFGVGFFPQMGIKGAALATVMARGCGLVAVLYILFKRDKLLTINFGKMVNVLKTWKQVLFIAGPAALTMLVTPVSMGVITKILAKFGKESVAAFGVATRVEMFALMVLAALGSVLMIFAGQNFSKVKFNRILMALKISLKFSLSWGVVVFVVILFSGQFIASLFTDDALVIKIAQNYFYIVGASYGFHGLLIISTSSFNGINKPYSSAFFSMLRMFVLYVPLAIIGAKLFAVYGVFWAGFIANVLAGIISFKYLWQVVKKLELAN